MSSVTVTASATPAALAQRAAPARAGMTPQDLALIDKLKARDAEVRQHEQAHLAAAGGLALSGASYTYQRGPNGVNYAVGGEVRIDTSAGSTPQETINRARAMAAAALAPAEPSGADRAVAAQAAQLEQQARAELAAEQSGQTHDGADPRRQVLQRAYDTTPPAPPTLDTFA
ncbi:catalase [Massilia atriviolacea]|uniref:Catalase n=1 Tax=Massilia atriviolacea TaxID=2495579 RepID=A0A430HMZ4_9BURK|nr:putative metalloprotease CJM1_0395 family protein [Massilia atriviolacea]RSZ58842.1 catalase [Massilia atriviolacea]